MSIQGLVPLERRVEVVESVVELPRSISLLPGLGGNSVGGTKKSRVSGATTPEKQEHILIGLAYELAERQLRDGTASPMIVSQLLKRGTLREELELEKLRRENAVLESKKTVLDSNTNTERLMAEAISAMRSYQGDE